MANNSKKRLISIVIYSSDYYEDCWHPFFELFFENFKTENNFEILLLTNSKDYHHDKLDVRAIKCGSDTSWSKRLKYGLEQAKSDLIFLLGDDFFLLSKMNEKVFDEQVNLINREKAIDHIRILFKKDKFKTQACKYENLDKIERFTKYRFLFAPSLWEREKLLAYVGGDESPFMAEKMGTYKSWILNDGLYCMSKEFLAHHPRLYDCGTSGVIVKGKWAEWSVPILEKKRLGIDFSIRGIRQESEKKGAMNKARIQQLKDPVATFKSYWNVLVTGFTR